MTGLWKTWIALWCWAVILFGALLATAGLPAPVRAGDVVLQREAAE